MVFRCLCSFTVWVPLLWFDTLPLHIIYVIFTTGINTHKKKGNSGILRLLSWVACLYKQPSPWCWDFGVSLPCSSAHEKTRTHTTIASSGCIGKEVVARLAKHDNFIVRSAAFTPSVLFFPLIVMPFDAFWCQLVHVGPPRNNSLICVLDTQSRIYLHAWTDLPAAPSSNASARSLTQVSKKNLIACQRSMHLDRSWSARTCKRSACCRVWWVTTMS